ncbi:hypothetical protein J5N97_007515 [Dioscorea zingiberensis]|uniref:Ribosomal protein L34Ae n=1 Tax=Dioscorea zingiberensis TaxID=325984 RepID=A0A9D5DCR7_9LILI|nr:hypothetical protein J5N97_007515 [Dioscorea zingiberensis]
MFLFHAAISLSLLLLLLHLSSFLLCKLFNHLHQRPAFKAKEHIHREEKELLPLNETSEKEDLIEDIVVGGEDLFLFFCEISGRNDTHVVEQDKDSIEETIFFDFQVEDSINVSESAAASYSPPHENHTEIPTIQSSDPVAFDAKTKEEDFSKEKRFIIIDHNTNSDSKKFKLDEIHGEGSYNYGDSVTGESSSWRSSTILRDSETEYPFSSSSRRSSCRWESYTMFRKYDEEMLFFDKITAQKLHETETLQSIKIQPRSVSQRIVHKLKIKKHKQFPRNRDPYQELESAYVAQICLVWEALSWNYSNFRRVSLDKNMEFYGCSARVAQEFQQFQVLLQWFIEIEPFERGPRPQVFARMKISSPKLLQVPEFRDSEGDEVKEGRSSRISSAEFRDILEDGITTFMNFLKADKKSHCETFKALFKKRSNRYCLIKKARNRKKSRLEGLRKRKVNEAQQMEILMGLIDMKVVSRVLRMPEISEEQLHWCEEKINKVRIWDGKTQRDSSPLFFPVA